MCQVSAVQAKSEAQVAALKEEVKQLKEELKEQGNELKELMLKLLDARAPMATVT
jgi:seryl-tRNA synthetase